MLFHLWVIYPILYFSIVRENPYSFWGKCGPAWITAWGTASSAATLPMTIKCARARGLPETAIKFMIPLGCLINMDGQASLLFLVNIYSTLIVKIALLSTFQLLSFSLLLLKELLSHR